MKTRGPDPLQDALALQSRIRSLRALLELQRRQIESLAESLYSSGPAGVAARRLVALKRSELQDAAAKPQGYPPRAKRR